MNAARLMTDVKLVLSNMELPGHLSWLSLAHEILKNRDRAVRPVWYDDALSGHKTYGSCHYLIFNVRLTWTSQLGKCDAHSQPEADW